MKTYFAKFSGRTKGAIGVYETVRLLIDAEDVAGALLKVYDTHDPYMLSERHLSELPIRYVATYYSQKNGYRQMMTACQGQYTYGTEAEAQHWIDAVTNPETNTADTLRSVYGDDPRFEVRAVACWPGHFDPVRSIFD